MKSVLIINGFDPQPGAQGELTSALVSQYSESFKKNDWQVDTSIATDYEIHSEQIKITNADLIVMQFPVYWYSVPAAMKRYIDEVLEMDFAYQASLKYADGPLLQQKKYLLSSTWAAPVSAFEQQGFLQDNSLTDIFLPLDLTMRFCGMKSVGDPVTILDVANIEGLDPIVKQIDNEVKRLSQ